MVGGTVYSPDRELWRAPGTGTVVVHPGGQGEYLGVLRLRIGADGTAEDGEWQPKRLNNDYTDDQAMLDLISKYSAE